MSDRTDPPTEQETAELEQARAANQKRLAALAMQDAHVDLTGGRLDLLINETIPEGTWWRHDFETRWEARAGVLLDEIEEQVRRARILNGGR